MIKKIGVLTSGGDSPGMNAAIRAVTRVAIARGMEVYGIRHGYKGLVDGDIFPLGIDSVSSILNRGGTFLGSARLKEFEEYEVRKKAVEVLEQYGIEALVTIGGDGTYRGALSLTKMGIQCVGIPGTIDNDIASTQYTIGYQTAVNTAVECVDKLRDTSSSHHRCSIVEVMGNRCDDLAVSTAISCGAEVLVTRSTGYNEDRIIQQLNDLHYIRKKDHAIVIISEKMGDVHKLAKRISDETQFAARATILGHIQRGGAPVPFDRVLASRLGKAAIDCLEKGRGGLCVGYQNNEIVAIPIEEALAMQADPSKPMLRLFEDLV